MFSNNVYLLQIRCCSDKQNPKISIFQNVPYRCVVTGWSPLHLVVSMGLGLCLVMMSCGERHHCQQQSGEMTPRDTGPSRDTGVMMSRSHAEICDTEDDEKWSQHFHLELDQR